MRMTPAVIAAALLLATACARQTPTAKVPADAKATTIRVAFDRVIDPTRRSTHSGIPTNIFVAEVGDEIVERQLTNDDRSSQPVWSPDGTKIAFVYRPPPSAAEPTETRDEVRVRNLDSGTEIKLFATLGLVREMVWSPDGKTVAVETASLLQIERKHMFMNYAVHLLKSTGEKTPHRFFLDAFSPSWSPDGQQIAFTCEFKPAEDIHHYAICVSSSSDLTTPEILTPGGCRPRWSPNGTQILYLAPCWQESEIFLMNSDGTDVRKLGRELKAVRNAGWSPDGEHIVFQAPAEENMRMASDGPVIEDTFVIHKDGTRLKSSGKNWGLRCINPVWTPDSVSIVARCNRTEETIDSLYLLSAAGKRKPRRIARKWILNQTVAVTGSP